MSYPAELADLLVRVNNGDATLLPALRKAFDQHPEVVAKLGNIVEHAENALLQLAAGTNPLGKEVIRQNMLDLKARLKATANSELEYLLIDRIAISWFSVNFYEVDSASRSGSPAATAAAQKRLDRAHARFLTATKSLAIVQKLLRHSPSTHDLLRAVS